MSTDLIDPAILERNETGRRIADHVNIHLLATDWFTIKHKWMAFRLEDGVGDDVLYDSHRDAVDHQRHNENQYLYIAFLSLGPQGANPVEVGKLLQFWRDAYRAGGRFVSKGDRYRMPLMTSAQNDYRNSLLQNDATGLAIREFIKEYGPR